MKIKMLKTAAGPNGCKSEGKEYEVTRDEAIALLSDNACTCDPADLKQPNKVETTKKPAPVVETATVPTVETSKVAVPKK